MFTIRFHKSKSKNYPLVVELAKKFNEHTFIDDLHTIHITVKELFEKWDFFNLIFWKSVDWVDSTFGYDGFDLHGHEDKTRIFYALQLAHVKWICLSEAYLSKIAPAYFDETLIERIKDEVFNPEDTDRILDLLIAEKNMIEYKNEFGHLGFEDPLRNSDFFGRRLRRDEKKNQM